MIGNSNQIVSIQMLRGLAASVVCFFHFTNGAPDYLPDDNFIKQVFSYGHYGVQIFFVVSGFILPYSLYKLNYRIKNFKNFFLRRLIRLEPPYLLSIFLVIALAYVSMLSPFYRGKPFTLDWNNFFFHFGYLNAFLNESWLNPVYWTLAIEFQFYLILGVLYNFFKDSSRPVQLLILFLFLILSLIIKDNNLIFHHAPMFIMGILTFLFFIKKIEIKSYVAIAFALGLIVFFTADIESVVAGLASMILIFVLSWPVKVFLFLGKISYSLYLIHVPIGMRIINISENLIPVVNINFRLAFIAVAFGVSVLSAYLFYLLVEKKSIEWTKKIFTSI